MDMTTKGQVTLFPFQKEFIKCENYPVQSETNSNSSTNYSTRAHVDFVTEDKCRNLAIKLLERNIFQSLYKKVMTNLFEDNTNTNMIKDMDLEKIREYFLSRKKTDQDRKNKMEEEDISQSEESDRESQVLKKKTIRLSKYSKNRHNKPFPDRENNLTKPDCEPQDECLTARKI